jgi:hypothetical protein
MEPAGVGKDGSESGRVYSLPFFLESANVASPGRLWAVFTLKKPAILQSYQGSCSGPTDSGLLQFDGGPRGVAGTTAAGHDGNTAVVLGSNIIVNQLPVPFVANVTSSGTEYVLPPTHLGLPVKSDLELLVFPKGGTAFVQCQITFILKEID